MINKREVTVDGLGLLSATRTVGRARLSPPLTGPLKVLHIFPSVLSLEISARPPITEIDRTDPWETVGYLALWACALLGIGLCLS